jgi:hypothetical protein
MATRTTVNLWTVYVRLHMTFWNDECGGGTRFFFFFFYQFCDVAEMAIIHKMI